MARAIKEGKEYRYRVYLTDALRIVGENTAKYVNGSYIRVRWADQDKPQKVETRTAEEIINHIKRKLSK